MTSRHTYSRFTQPLPVRTQRLLQVSYFCQHRHSCHSPATTSKTLQRVLVEVCLAHDAGCLCLCLTAVGSARYYRSVPVRSSFCGPTLSVLLH